MRPRLPLLIATTLLALSASAACAETARLQPTEITEWKAVYGQIETRDRIPARARLGGTLVELSVVEGDAVTAGQPIARVLDEKLAFQLSALKGQHAALDAQLANATAELQRGEDLLKKGVATNQQLDALRAAVDVVKGQIAALEAQSDVITQQDKEGTVLAPAAGRVLDVPVAAGGVVMPGEPIATIGSGGTFLRISVPERHAASLHQGDKIEIDGSDGAKSGTLSRIYPLIQNGRVTADVEIAGLPDSFVDARILVRLPVGTRQALMVPLAAITTEAGLDFVALETASGPSMRTVVPGQHQTIDGTEMVEILSGLTAGDAVLPVAPKPEAAKPEAANE